MSLAGPLTRTTSCLQAPKSDQGMATSTLKRSVNVFSEIIKHIKKLVKIEFVGQLV